MDVLYIDMSLVLVNGRVRYYISVQAKKQNGYNHLLFPKTCLWFVEFVEDE